MDRWNLIPNDNSRYRRKGIREERRKKMREARRFRVQNSK
jgi:hypothetical protein